jgi:hypothetical protein
LPDRHADPDAHPGQGAGDKITLLPVAERRRRRGSRWLLLDLGLGGRLGAGGAGTRDPAHLVVGLGQPPGDRLLPPDQHLQAAEVGQGGEPPSPEVTQNTRPPWRCT